MNAICRKAPRLFVWLVGLRAGLFPRKAGRFPSDILEKKPAPEPEEKRRYSPGWSFRQVVTCIPWLVAGLCLSLSGLCLWTNNAAAASRNKNAVAPSETGQSAPPAGRALAAAYLREKLLFQTSMYDELDKSGLFANSDDYYSRPSPEALVALFWQAAKEPVVFERLKKDLLDTARPVEQRREQAARLVYRARDLQYTIPWLAGDDNPEKRSRYTENEDEQATAVVKGEQNKRAYIAWVMRLSLLLRPNEWPEIQRIFSEESTKLLWRQRDNTRVMETVRKMYENPVTRGDLTESDADMQRLVADPDAFVAMVKDRALLKSYTYASGMYRALLMPVQLFLPAEAETLAKPDAHTLVLSPAVTASAETGLPEFADGEQPNGLLIHRMDPLSPEQRKDLQQLREEAAPRFDRDATPETPFPANINRADGEQLYAIASSGGPDGFLRAPALWKESPLRRFASVGEGLHLWDSRSWDWVIYLSAGSHSSMLLLSAAPDADVRSHLAGLSVMAGNNERLRHLDHQLKGLVSVEASGEAFFASASKAPSGAAHQEAAPLRFTSLRDGGLFLLLAAYADASELDRLFGPITAVWIKDEENGGDVWFELRRKSPKTSTPLRLGHDPVFALPDTLLTHYDAYVANTANDAFVSRFQEIMRTYPGGNPDLEKAGRKPVRAAVARIRSLCGEFKLDGQESLVVVSIFAYIGLSDANLAELRELLGKPSPELRRIDAITTWAEAKRPFPK